MVALHGTSVPTPKADLIPRTRTETGFYKDLSFRGQVVNRSVDGGQYTMSIDQQPLTDSGYSALQIYSVIAALQRNENDVVAYINVDVLRLKAGQSISDVQFVDLCDTVSPELFRMAAELTDHSIARMEEVLCQGALSRIGRLEVREDCLGTGADVVLVNSILEYLRSEYGAILFSLEVFPLQYEWSIAPARSHADVISDEKFEEAREKLSNYYAYKFGCVSLSSTSEHLVGGLPGWVVEVDSFGWTITGDNIHAS